MGYQGDKQSIVTIFFLSGEICIVGLMFIPDKGIKSHASTKSKIIIDKNSKDQRHLKRPETIYREKTTAAILL
jgi:hypothetical protein